MREDNVFKHIERLHKAAESIEGKFVLASYGEDPINGRKIAPKIQHFKVGEVNSMSQAAINMAREKNRNVYTPLALMRTDLPASHKGCEKDVVAILGFVADFDKGLGATYEKRCPITPSYAIETSQNNVQAGFILDNPFKIKTDADRDFAKNLACKMAHACDGADSCGADISHVWRIEGLPNYPNKKKVNEGRPAEAFISRAKTSGTDTRITLSQLAALPEPKNTQDKNKEKLDAEYVKTVDINHLREEGYSDLVDSIECKYEGDRSEHVARVVSSLLKMGYGTGDIIDLIASYPSGIGERYERDENRIEDDVLRMASKWGDETLSSSAGKHAYDFEELAEIDEDEILPRRWILGNFLLGGKVSVCIAPPGVGKSTLTLAMGLSIATNKNLIDVPVIESGPVAFINNEDEMEEMHRRVHSLIKFHGLNYSQIKGNVFLQSGDRKQFCIAKRDPHSKDIKPYHKQDIIDFCIKKNIKVLFVDPFLETHEADENDNRQISEVAKIYREIAQETGCAVCLVHHTRKEQGNSTKGHAGNMDSGRGASSLIGVSRIVFTLYNMDEQSAKEYGIAAEERHLYVRLDEAKGNMSLISDKAKWFKRESVSLNNGESVGVLSPAENMQSVFEDKNLQLEQQFIATLLSDQAFEDILMKKSASRGEFVSAMFEAKLYLGNKTETRSTIEQRMESRLIGKGISHNGCTVYMTKQGGKRGRYTVHINMEEPNTANLPVMHEKISGTVENTGLRC